MRTRSVKCAALLAALVVVQMGLGGPAWAAAAARPAIRFGDPVIAIPSSWSYEPSVAVDRKGRIFVTDVLGDTIAVSTNGGADFSELAGPPGPVDTRGITGRDAPKRSAETRSSPSSSKRGKSSSYSTPIYGAWVQPGCLPTSAAPSADKPTHITIVCTLTYTGSWTGQAIEYIEGDAQTDLVLVGTNDYYVYGRDGRDNTCGSLHVLENVTVDALTSATHSIGRILGGTGDWVGSTGTVLIDGSVWGGPGVGGYSGTWTRPGHPKPVASVPCVPPAPTNLPPPPLPAP
jgi:hypothetical protein